MRCPASSIGHAAVGIEPDGDATNGHCSLVIPVRTARASRRWSRSAFPTRNPSTSIWRCDAGAAGCSAPAQRRPAPPGAAARTPRATDLTRVAEYDACRVVAGLYRSLHVPALPALRPLASSIERWTADLAQLPRSAPIPRRLVEQAIALGRDLGADRAVPPRLIHTDLHYGNVLAHASSDTGRERWLAIDPKPVNGDPHYEIAPMLWNR